MDLIFLLSSIISEVEQMRSQILLSTVNLPSGERVTVGLIGQEISTFLIKRHIQQQFKCFSKQKLFARLNTSRAIILAAVSAIGAGTGEPGTPQITDLSAEDASPWRRSRRR